MDKNTLEPIAARLKKMSSGFGDDRSGNGPGSSPSPLSAAEMETFNGPLSRALGGMVGDGGSVTFGVYCIVDCR